MIPLLVALGIISMVVSSFVVLACVSLAASSDRRLQTGSDDEAYGVVESNPVAELEGATATVLVADALPARR